MTAVRPQVTEEHTPLFLAAPSVTRDSVLRTLFISFGLTSVILSGLFEPILDQHPLAVYHWSGSAAALFGPPATIFTALWLALFPLLLSARNTGRWRLAVWAGLLISLPWVIFRTLEMLRPEAVPYWFHFPRVILGVGLWLAAVLAWPRVQTQAEKFLHFCSILLLFLALSGSLFVGRFCFYWWSARALNHAPPAGPALPAPSSASGHRIIWLLLDELSYQQVYAQRYPGLALPTFDSLAAQSSVFTRTVPAGSQTERVVPALLTGKPVQDLHSSATGQLATLNPTTHQWARFDQRNTVFQDALNTGRRTGVAGWYNPYCRILPAVLNDCVWSVRETLPNGLRSDRDYRANLLNAASALVGNGLLRKFLWITLGVPRAREHDPEMQIADFQELSTVGDKLLADPSVGFVLIHLPVPHPQGFYNRRTGQFTTGPATYIDNLALADRYLAHVRFLLQQSGQWDSSTVVISGDHGWRTTLLWKKAHRWVPEEQRASLGGRFDERPAYIVKLPNQQTGASIDAPFPILRTRRLFDSLFAGQFQTPAELRRWVEQGR